MGAVQSSHSSGQSRQWKFSSNVPSGQASTQVSSSYINLSVSHVVQMSALVHSAQRAPQSWQVKSVSPQVGGAQVSTHESSAVIYLLSRHVVQVVASVHDAQSVGQS